MAFYFVIVIVIGNFIILNLFLAILLENFATISDDDTENFGSTAPSRQPSFMQQSLSTMRSKMSMVPLLGRTNKVAPIDRSLSMSSVRQASVTSKGGRGHNMPERPMRSALSTAQLAAPPQGMLLGGLQSGNTAAHQSALSAAYEDGLQPANSSLATVPADGQADSAGIGSPMSKLGRAVRHVSVLEPERRSIDSPHTNFKGRGWEGGTGGDGNGKKKGLSKIMTLTNSFYVPAHMAALLSAHAHGLGSPVAGVAAALANPAIKQMQQAEAPLAAEQSSNSVSGPCPLVCRLLRSAFLLPAAAPYHVLRSPALQCNKGVIAGRFVVVHTAAQRCTQPLVAEPYA